LGCVWHCAVQVFTIEQHTVSRRFSPFCETDLALAVQEAAQASKPLDGPGQRYPDESIMLGSQPLEGAPVHPLGLAAAGVRNASLPAQPLPDVAGSPHGSIVRGFPLAGIRQPVTVTTGEDASAAQVEQCHAHARAQR
jgi:hypothetical protein